MSYIYNIIMSYIYNIYIIYGLVSQLLIIIVSYIL